MMRMTDALPDDLHAPQHPAVSCPESDLDSPFARVAIGQREFTVAQRNTEEGGLAFHEDGTDEWFGIERTLEDGWVRIAADFLLHDPNLLQHFLRTHAVRVDGWYKVGDTIRFDTLGTVWSVFRPEVGVAEVTYGDMPMVRLDPVIAFSLDLRHQAIDLLIQAFPDLRQMFDKDIDHWAYRLATGATITPIM